MTAVRLPQRCVACNWPRATGIISYGTMLHEPHCEACCKEWTTMLITAPIVLRTPLTLKDFRQWQAERKARMAA